MKLLKCESNQNVMYFVRDQNELFRCILHKTFREKKETFIKLINCIFQSKAGKISEVKTF